MRRAVLTLGGTVAGLAALLSFKTHSLAAVDPPASPPATPASTAQPTGSGTGSSSASPAASATATAATQAAARTVTGAAVNTQYGPMQVQVTLAGTKITKVTVLQRTDDGTESDQIDATAIPRLTSETLAAQSALDNT